MSDNTLDQVTLVQLNIAYAIWHNNSEHHGLSFPQWVMTMTYQTYANALTYLRILNAAKAEQNKTNQ